jgi:hypothetical protein
VKRAFDDAREIFHAIDAIHAFAERPEDLTLIGVLMQVHFLMGMAAIEVRRDVAGNHDHWDRIERRVCHPGRGIGEPRTEMRQQHARLSGGARITVSGVCSNLLVPRRDVTDAALRERIEEPDDGVTAQAEDHIDAKALEIFGEQVGRNPRLRTRHDALGRRVREIAHV